jgi:hypothetical protein
MIHPKDSTHNDKEHTIYFHALFKALKQWSQLLVLFGFFRFETSLIFGSNVRFTQTCLVLWNNQPWIDPSQLIQWNSTRQKEHSVSHRYIKTSRYAKTCWKWLLMLYSKH